MPSQTISSTIASDHNLANHNSLNILIDLAKNTHEPVHSLKLDSETSIKCLSEDFNGFLLFAFSIGNDSFIIEQFFKRLGIDLGKQLKFNLHINKTCKSASNEDNASDRLFWDRNSWIWRKKVLTYSFILDESFIQTLTITF